MKVKDESQIYYQCSMAKSARQKLNALSAMNGMKHGQMLERILRLMPLREWILEIQNHPLPLQLRVWLRIYWV